MAKHLRRDALLNDIVQEDICRALSWGSTFNHACEMAGIRAKTGSVWLSRGRNYDSDLESGRDPREIDEPFYDFLCAVELARNTARVAVAQTIMEAILGDVTRDEETGKIVGVARKPDPELGLKWLERQDPEHWGRTWRPESAPAREAERTMEERLAHGEQLIAAAAEQIAKDAATGRRKK